MSRYQEKTLERTQLPPTRNCSETCSVAATAPHRSDGDSLGLATGPGRRVADTVGMFQLYRRRTNPLCGGLCRIPTQPNCNAPRNVTGPTRDRQYLKRSARPSDIHQYCVTTSISAATCYRTNDPTPLYLSTFRPQPIPGQFLDLRAAIYLPPIHLQPTPLRIPPSGPPLVRNWFVSFIWLIWFI